MYLDCLKAHLHSSMERLKDGFTALSETAFMNLHSSMERLKAAKEMKSLGINVIYIPVWRD